MTLGRYGKGTATDDMVDYLGLAEKEKYVLFSTLSNSLAYDLSKKLRERTKGESYSVIVPISSVGGKETMNYINV